MSPDELETLEDRVRIIFAPAPGKHGKVYPFAPIQFLEHQELPPGIEFSPPGDLGTAFVYLSPEIERHRQDYIDSVVAHEFAHVLLHPPDAATYESIECEADKKVQLWGFKPAYTEKACRN